MGASCFRCAKRRTAPPAPPAPARGVPLATPDLLPLLSISKSPRGHPFRKVFPHLPKARETVVGAVPAPERDYNMAKKIELSSEQHIRIKKLSTLEQIQSLAQRRHGDSAKINSIINEALELALPCMIEQTDPESFKNILEKSTQRLIMNQNRQTQKLLQSLQKLIIVQTITESMTGSLVHELEYFLKSKNVQLDPELLEEFKNSIPTRFEDDKQTLIDQLLKPEE